MTNNYQKTFSAKVKSFIKEIPKDNLTKEIKNFVPIFFAQMPAIDIENISPIKASMIVQSSYSFIQSRDINKPKIRIIPFDHKAAGLKRSRIVIEILNDDMPFLVDSITQALSAQDFTIYDTIHPQINVKRDENCKLLDVKGVDDKSDGYKCESLIHLQTSPIPDDITEEKLIADLENVLEHILLAVTDWKPLLQKARDVRDDIATISSGFATDEVTEVADFIDWLCRKNFVFLGYVEYDFYNKDGEDCLEFSKDSELGIYKINHNILKRRGLSCLPKEQQQFAREPSLVEVIKSNIKSIIHRPVHMDYIAIKKFDHTGKVVGERRFIGMFTSIVYYQSADNIPFIRRKIARTLKRANFDPSSHNGKSLRAILEFFPRDELFQMSEEDLFDISIGVMSLEARPDVRLFIRSDKYERFVSCLIYVPRDRFSTYIRKQIGDLLEKAFNGQVSGFYTQMTDSPLARLHLIIRTKPGSTPIVDIVDIENKIKELTSIWSDELRELFIDAKDENQGEQLYRSFSEAFSKNYINNYTPKEAIADVDKIIECVEDGVPAVQLEVNCNNPNFTEACLRLKIYTTERNTPLSSMLPVLENMGCQVQDVHPYTITPKWDKAAQVIMHDFRVTIKGGVSADIVKVKPRFEEALVYVWCDSIENDNYNSLVLFAGLSYRQVEMLRAYGKYLKQTGLPYNEAYIATSLSNNPAITALLVELFELRFEVCEVKERNEKVDKTRAEIDEMLANVSNLTEDLIIRHFADTILATLRTNFYQTTDENTPKDYISFKFDSGLVPNLPLPRPYREIFVYSLRVEGIHLRGGKVARGGLRWSDRPEDFRTEVLGLMKAQMVKNTVIVPIGSKGGFVVKQPPVDGGRDAFMAEGIECYKTFLSGLLDVTDNIIGDEIIPPTNVIRHDEDDPYLVVAADKGTATFSDIANSVSEDYGFWLGDAFASGGSVGYDHKKMGITARGAWVSVMRHFREMGIDTQTQDFTVAAIGDMAGDVFGNGMLLSKHIQLVAAFNHRHIFIDPTPDSATTYKERKRLFDEVKGWDEYNTKLLSKGGEIYERSAKNIKLSKQAQVAIGANKAQMTPDEVIIHILKSKVDLLWNGGIGTYVKASSESHDEVGDRANNAVRINGDELGCKVIGEGGNLGFTQLGRIEYSRNGGRINTDAIDNSAGVDCSDHEVNIKIAMVDAMANNGLSRKKRDATLAKMTDNVSDLVLRDNQLQTQTLTICEHHAYDNLEQQAQMIRSMEQTGRLNREVEFLPSDKELVNLRAEKKGLSRPELAVLLSYAKLELYDEVVNSSLPKSSYFINDLIDYFPTEMRSNYRKQIENHRLNIEIISTIITNDIVNRAGITFYHTISEETGRHNCDISRAYIIVRDVFNLPKLWQEIEDLDGKVEVSTQIEMFTDISRFLERMTIWFLNNRPQPLDLQAAIDDYADGIKSFQKSFQQVASETINKAYSTRQKYFNEKGVNTSLSDDIASLEAMASSCDIVSAANATNLPIIEVGAIYYEVGAQLQLGWMRHATSSLNADTHWDKLAIKTLVNDIYDEQRRLCLSVINQRDSGEEIKQAISQWVSLNQQAIERSARLIKDLKSAVESRDISMFLIAVKQIRLIAR